MEMKYRIIRTLKVLEDPKTINQVRRAVHPERTDDGWRTFDVAFRSLLDHNIVLSADTSAYRSKIGRRYWLAPVLMWNQAVQQRQD
jgi:hypothetical protein